LFSDFIDKIPLGTNQTFRFKYIDDLMDQKYIDRDRIYSSLKRDRQMHVEMIGGGQQLGERAKLKFDVADQHPAAGGVAGNHAVRHLAVDFDRRYRYTTRLLVRPQQELLWRLTAQQALRFVAIDVAPSRVCFRFDLYRIRLTI
jgi:hypothetical protein